MEKFNLKRVKKNLDLIGAETASVILARPNDGALHPSNGTRYLYALTYLYSRRIHEQMLIIRDNLLNFDRVTEVQLTNYCKYLMKELADLVSSGCSNSVEAVEDINNVIDKYLNIAIEYSKLSPDPNDCEEVRKYFNRMTSEIGYLLHISPASIVYSTNKSNGKMNLKLSKLNRSILPEESVEILNNFMLYLGKEIMRVDEGLVTYDKEELRNKFLKQLEEARSIFEENIIPAKSKD